MSKFVCALNIYSFQSGKGFKSRNCRSGAEIHRGCVKGFGITAATPNRHGAGAGKKILQRLREAAPTGREVLLRMRNKNYMIDIAVTPDFVYEQLAEPWIMLKSAGRDYS